MYQTDCSKWSSALSAGGSGSSVQCHHASPSYMPPPVPTTTLATVRQDQKDLHRTTFNTTQCLLTPATFFFFFKRVTGTQNVMHDKILLQVSISIQCKVPALLTSIQPDKRRCSYNSLSDICWEYITVKIKLVICLQIDTFSSRCKWC